MLLFSSSSFAFKDMYFPDQKGLKIEQTTESSGVNSELRLKVVNEGMDDSSIFFPLYPQMNKQPGVFLSTDSCAFKILKNKESCEVKIQYSQQAFKRSYSLYMYGLEDKAYTFEIGSKEYISNKVEIDSSTSVEEVVFKQPLSVGFYSSVSLEVDCNKVSPEDRVLGNLEKATFRKEKKKCFIDALYYPVSEDFHKEVVVIEQKGKRVYQAQLTIPAILKKVLSLKDPWVFSRAYFKKDMLIPLKLEGDLLLSKDEPLDTSLFQGKVMEGKGEFIKQEGGFYYKPLQGGIHTLKVSAVGLEKDIKIILSNLPTASAPDLIADNTVLDNNKGNIFLYNKIYLKNDLIIKNSKERVSYLWAEEISGPGKIKFESSFKGIVEAPALGITAIPNGPSFSCEGEILFVSPRVSVVHDSSSCVKYMDMNPLVLERAIQESVHKEVEDNIFLGAFREIISYNLAFTFMILVFFLIYYIPKFRQLRSQPNRSFYQGQLVSEAFWCFVSVVLIQYGVQIFSTVLNRQEYLQIYEQKEQYGLFYYYFSFLGIVMLHDTFFYWTHRLLHLPWFYKNIHFRHHKSKVPSPLTAYNFHPLEALMHFSFVPLALYFIPVHANVLVFFLYYHMFFNVLGHSGVHFTGKLVKTPLVYLYNMNNHHDLHHEKNRGNYSLYFNFWDRIMGTNVKEYLDQHEKDN